MDTVQVLNWAKAWYVPPQAGKCRSLLRLPVGVKIACENGLSAINAVSKSKGCWIQVTFKFMWADWYVVWRETFRLR